MTLGSISCAKHLGGVCSIGLLSASEIGSLSYDSAERCFSSLLPIDGGELRDVAFAEGSAWLEEVVEPDGTTHHKLRFALRGLQSGVVEELRRLSQEGMVAVVGLHGGEKLLVGYSALAAADYPLRLSEVRLDSGSSKEQRTSLSVTLCSTDGSPSCHYID